MALAIVLLSGSGVLIRSLVQIVGAETGVRDPEHVLVGLLRLPSSRYPPDETRREYFDRLQARLQTIPGVDGQSVSTALPVGSGFARPFQVEGKPSPGADEELVQVLRVGAGYFQVLGAPLISGRDFNDGDRPSALPVAIVNESFAARFWPGEEAVGKRVRSTEPNSGEWRVVIGVAPNIMQGDPLRQTFKPLIYVPFAQEPAFRAAYFLVRTRVPPHQISQSVQSLVRELDPDVPLESFMTLRASFAFDRDFMDAEHSELGKHAAVAPVFGAIALLLAAIGLSAVVSHSVSQRVKEIGVRMAIGANAKDVRQMILREGMLPVAAGLLFGLAGSIAVNRLLQSQLVGVSPYDPATMAGAPLILIAVALVACVAPVRRAVTVDPVIALRHE
jgi:putative ABC transport system permease protein